MHVNTYQKQAEKVDAQTGVSSARGLKVACFVSLVETLCGSSGDLKAQITFPLYMFNMSTTL